jgi:hypothetical protein
MWKNIKMISTEVTYGDTFILGRKETDEIEYTCWDVKSSRILRDMSTFRRSVKPSYSRVGRPLYILNCWTLSTLFHNVSNYSSVEKSNVL